MRLIDRLAVAGVGILVLQRPHWLPRASSRACGGSSAAPRPAASSARRMNRQNASLSEETADLATTFSPIPRTINSVCAPIERSLNGPLLTWRLVCKGQLDMELTGEFNFDSPHHYTGTVRHQGGDGRNADGRFAGHARRAVGLGVPHNRHVDDAFAIRSIRGRIITPSSVSTIMLSMSGALGPLSL